MQQNKINNRFPSPVGEGAQRADEADNSKFKEWLLLKKYSPATTETTVRIVEYFRQ